jgi:hypothetical protein
MGNGLVDRLGCLAGDVGVDVHEGVQLAVLLVDGGQALVKDGRRFQLTSPDTFCSLHDGAHRGSH